MQHESSITHRKNIESGLSVLWERSTGESDSDWSVVCYSDDSRWLFDNAGAQKLFLIGTISDGAGEAEILETDSGAIIALYGAGPESFADRATWLSSLSEADKPEAESILQNA